MACRLDIARRVSVAEPAMYDLKPSVSTRFRAVWDVSVAEPAMYDLKLR